MMHSHTSDQETGASNEPVKNKVSSLSSVIVISGKLPSHSELAALNSAMSSCSRSSELVIVANGVSQETALALKNLVQKLEDVTCIFLAHEVDVDSATLAGCENSISDYILVAEQVGTAALVLSEFVAMGLEGFDLVVAHYKQTTPHRRRDLYALASTAYFHIYRSLTGISVDRRISRMRLMSRPASQYLLERPEAPMLLRAENLAAGFPTARAQIALAAPDERESRNWRRSVGRAFQFMIGSSAAPLRMVSLMALCSALLSMIYSLYIVGAYLTLDEVQPGWTTLSLQTSGQLFFFSLMFMMIAEYLLQIRSNMTSRHRAPVTQEIRSPMSRHTAHIDVLDKGEDGELVWSERTERLSE
jgi:hypothetical protein